MESVWSLVIYFAICSFLGWIIQVCVYLFQLKKIINNGFLYGPFIPLFGFTALIIYFFNLYFVNYPLQIRLIFYFILPTVMEYFTGFLLDKIFKVKLWDYSHQKFNIKGRISLGISLVWFILILFHVFVLQNIIFSLINYFSESVQIVVAVIFLIYFSIDFFSSTKVFYYFSKLNKNFGKINIKNINKKFKNKIKSISNKVKISPVFKRNLSKDFEEFVTKFSKR